ncbi:hypothetical protein [Actinoallomurus sp. CA-142502]|uniref:hypothetical protein n=1 Tax=Actinoallomurus sp. CA-142502 TaxID=3239885 RepID=UPI003D8A47D5
MIAAVMPHSALAASVEDPTTTGLVTRSGEPLAHADIVAQAWPNRSELDKIIHEGGKVALPTVAVTRTDTSGHFSFRLPDGIDSRYVGDDGKVDLRIVASDSKNAVTWQYTATHGASSSAARSGHRVWSTAKSDAGGDARPADLRFDLSPSSPQAYDATDDPAEWVTNSGTKLTRSAASHARSTVLLPHTSVRSSTSNAEPCVLEPSTLYTQNPERFAVVSAWSGAKGTVYQSQSVSHTLGIGIQVDGQSGAWTQNGTESINLTQGSGATLPGVADATVGNEVNYRYYRGTLNCVNTSYVEPESTYAFLSIAERHAHVSYTACAAAFHGATYWKDTAKNVTYGAGLELGWMSLSAQSGWTSDTKIEWVITQDSKLCGSTSSGWASSPEMNSDPA